MLDEATRERLEGATIAPYGPGVVLNNHGDGSGLIRFQGQSYPYASYADLLERADDFPFTVELIRIYPDAPDEYWQVKLGDSETP
jgi:hypothetical protein